MKSIFGCSLLLAWVLILGFLPHVCRAEAAPHFVIVLVDDFRWEELGCTGYPFVRTPHIDRIASEGARVP